MEKGLNPGVTYYTSMEFNRLGERSLRRTVGGDRRFNILTVENSNKCSDAPVCTVIDSRKINVIGSEDGDR